MKKFLIPAAALMAGTAALAQTAPVASPAAATPAPMAHPMADKVMTRAETVAMVRDHFARLDQNKDGVITTAEAAEGQGKWAEHRMEMGGGPMGDPNAAFDRLDTNKNGSISRDEFAKGHEQRMERRIVMRDKRKDATQEAKDGKRHEHRMGGMGAHMIAMADTNKDGKVTEAEAEAMALQHFDQMDTNHDGKVTPEERRAARPMMMKQMHEEKTTG